MMDLLLDPNVWAAFLTLTALELVLGIDNVIFISILVDKLPIEKRELARRIGLFGAMFMRIGLLMILAWLVGLTEPIITIMNQSLSGRDLVLLLGGLFLLWKSVGEIHETMEGSHDSSGRPVAHKFSVVIIQIMLVDIVFSLDSIITAIGMVEQISVMIAAVIASVGLMMVFAKAIGEFVSAHPTIKMLALAFLVVIGVVLIAESLGHHVPKGYIYSAMAFSVAVEMLNLRMRKRSARPVDLIASFADQDNKDQK
jgi:predicted tellurium resistance membrane protein TerC